MRVLITAGSTEVPIDKVRSIGNIFKGKTGWAIAKHFAFAGCDVTLLTSTVHEPHCGEGSAFRCLLFRTFDELAKLMEEEVQNGTYDTIIHSAAVSDYKVAGVFVDQGLLDTILAPIDTAGKISSAHHRLYLGLKPTIKLVDQIRHPWGFKGKLVKFKLQVGISDAELIEVARRSMASSQANFIVANCLEWAKERAYILGADGSCEHVVRGNLPAELYRRLV